MVVLIALSSLICNLIGRRRIQQIQLFKGPNRILLTLEDLTFINPQLSKRVRLVIPPPPTEQLAVDSYNTSSMFIHNSNSRPVTRENICFAFKIMKE